MTEFVITFRETLEAALIVGIVGTFLVKHGYTSLIKQIWLGILAALVGSVFFAWGLREIQLLVGNTAYEKLFEAVMMYITAGILLYMVVWMTKGHYKMFTLPTQPVNNDPACLGCELNQQSHNLKSSSKKTIKQTVLSATQSAIGTKASRGVFRLIFFAILREGFETAIFLYSSIALTGSFSHLGFRGGIILASILGYVLFVAGKRISLQKFFTSSSVLLIIFAAGMATYGTHELEEFLVKQEYIQKTSITRVRNIREPQTELPLEKQSIRTFNEAKQKRYHPRHDTGKYGVFAKGFLGYNSDPNIVEPFVRILVLFLGFGLTFKGRKIT